jgi:uncharacterized protein (DUF983 family)
VAAILHPRRESKASVLRGIVNQLCPRCRAGKIFRRSILRFPSMYERCPVCGLKFEREQGYFLGAMYISYGLALVTIAVIALLLWAFTSGGLQRIVIWAVLLFLPLAPVVTFFSRVLWIYFDRAIDPEDHH